jgi:hypothetical protein
MAIATVNLVVPVGGDGPQASIANLVGQKTVILTGNFSGQYILLAGHAANALVPVLQFDSGGVEGIKQTLDEAYQFAAVRTRANTVPGGTVTMEVTGVTKPGENYFATLATIAAGASGSQGIVDTAALFPPTGLEQGINIICEGDFEGNVIVNGSNDGVTFNPLGQFTAGPRGRTLLGNTTNLEFGPLTTADKVRYVQVVVAARVNDTTRLTIGGQIPAAGGGGAGTGLEADDTTGRSTTLNAIDQEILYEEPIDFDGVLPGTIMAAELSIVAKVSAPSTAIFRLVIGSTTPGDTVGGTVAVLITTSSTAKVLLSNLGGGWPVPGGKVLAQITGINNTPATCVSQMYSFKWRLA